MSLLTGSAYAQTSPSTQPAQTPAAQAPAAQSPAPAAPQAAARGNRAEAPAASGPVNPAIKTTEGNNANVTAPVAGANSVTEGEAKTRLESQGFTNVSGLKKDDQGIWRGKAQRDGKPVDVALDFQGNVFSN